MAVPNEPCSLDAARLAECPTPPQVQVVCFVPFCTGLTTTLVFGCHVDGRSHRCEWSYLRSRVQSWQLGTHAREPRGVVLFCDVARCSNCVTLSLLCVCFVCHFWFPCLRFDLLTRHISQQAKVGGGEKFGEKRER